jgi:hypothetical protein
MKRKQIYIDEAQETAVRRVAACQGKSEAAVIREALERYLAIEEPALGEIPNPLLDLIGIVDDPDAPTDGSINYKADLYGAPRRP